MKALFFDNGHDWPKVVSAPIRSDDVYKAIYSYVHEKNPEFKIYYIREWTDESIKTTWYDVGSHTEFFKVVDNCCATCAHLSETGECRIHGGMVRQDATCEDWW